MSFLAASVALLLSSVPSIAQEGGVTATLRGTVADATGAVLPGADVTLTNTGTKALHAGTTDDRGGFLFAGLWPGTYDLKIELSGFKTSEQRGIAIGPSDTRDIDVQLEIGPRTDTVVVTATNDVIQTATGAREGVITAKQIENLSVISRSALELLRILPGVVAPDQSVLELVSQDGGVNDTNGYTVNGIRSTRNAVSLDGSGVNDLTCNCGLIVSLNDDMVQEVKVQSSNYAAEYGTGGVSVSAVTKSGTSHVHGAAYWYGRDYHWSANDRSNSITGVEKTKSNYFYPGGNVGGPIPLPGSQYNKDNDKLFFWVGLEVQRQMFDAGSHLSTTMSQAARTGDLSEFLANRGQNLNHPAVVNIPGGFPGAGTPAPNNDLTPYVTPLGRAMANLYPLPNHTDPDNRYNYVFSVPYPINRVESRGRVDWNISNAVKAYVRMALDTEHVDSPRGVWGTSELELATRVLGHNTGRSYAANVVQVLGPSMTNELLVSFSGLTQDNPFQDPSKLRKDALGVTFEGFLGNQSPYIPIDQIHSWGGSQLGDYWTGGNDLHASTDERVLGDKLTKVTGAHSLKFGGSVGRYDREQGYPNDESGLMVYDPGSTPGSTGSQIGDLLVGRPNQIQQGTRIGVGAFRTWQLDAFAQDSWHIRPHLTVEYGVRVGYWTNYTERHGLGAWFDPTMYDPTKGSFIDPPQDQQLNGVRYTARGQAPPGVLPHRTPFAIPRLNAAWDISGNGTTVLRGGYGLFESRRAGDGESFVAQFMPPNALHVGADAFYDTNLGGTGLTYDTAHLIPVDALMGSQSISTLTPSSFTFLKTHTYSISLARRIPWNQILDVAYVGTTGRDLGSSVNMNVVPLSALSTGVAGNADLSIPVNRVNLDESVVNSKRPFPAYGFLEAVGFEGTSQYHSLQVTLSRQTGKRLQYFVAYTLSRNTGSLGGILDPFDASRTYGVLDRDRRHILNVSWNALLPDGARGRLDTAAVRGLLNGWQLSGISTLVSGIPIHLGFSGDVQGPGVTQAWFGTPDVVGPDPNGFTSDGNSVAPEYTCDPRLGGSAVGEKMLNINCIKVPDFGKSPPLLPPYDMRTPWRMNHDLTLFKNFAVHADQKLQFRAGFFNIFNMAYANTDFGNDIDRGLETTCNRRVNHVPNGIGDYADDVCDPTGGYSFTPNTIENFGKINIKRGHRVVELVVKYYF